MPDVCMFGRTLDEAAANAYEAITVTVDTLESEVKLEKSTRWRCAAPARSC